jgi:uncharacterized protein GlcG (DUF336 family)
MDGAPTASVELAFARGVTALEWGIPTQNLTFSSSPGGRYFDLQVLSETYASGPGGIPLSEGGSVGVACEFDSEDALYAPQAIALSVLSGQKPKRKTRTEATLPVIGSLITLEQATFIADYIISLAPNTRLAVAIVDAGAIPKVITTTQHVPSAIIKAAVSKAISARLFDLPDSSILNDVSQPGQPAYGVQITNGGLFPLGGGALILNGKGAAATQALGAVGIEGDITPESAKDFISKALDQFYARNDKILSTVTLRDRRGVTAKEAQEAIRAAIAARKALGDKASPGVYAVRDLSGYLRAFYYEDGVEKGAADIALKSSRATALFQIPSEGVGEYSRPNLPLYNIELLYGGLVSFESAYPLTTVDGVMIGAIGVSGTGMGKGTSNDALIARAAAKAVAQINDPCAKSADICLDLIQPITVANISSPSPYGDEAIGLAQVAALINAVQQYGIQNQQSACASVFDAGVRLKGQLCANDAFLGATDLTQRKSISGQAFGKPNQDLQSGQLPSGIVYKIEVTNGGLFFNGGGAPLKDKGHTVASVGVAGAKDDIAAVAPAVQLWDSQH